MLSLWKPPVKPCVCGNCAIPQLPLCLRTATFISESVSPTDFAVAIVSDAFAGKTQIARHRLVNSLLKDEFDTMGLHALSLRLKTPQEWEGEIAKAQAQ